MQENNFKNAFTAYNYLYFIRQPVDLQVLRLKTCF
jgi:hypothetical protein